MLNREQYLLTQVQEECAELSQRAAKAIRFGLYEVQEGQELNNWERFRIELIDLMAVVATLDEDFFTEDDFLADAKIKKIEKYMQLSRDRGILRDNEY